MTAWIDRNPFTVLGALLIFFAGMFFLGLFAASEGTQSFAAQSKGTEEPPISKYEEHLLALDREAVDLAYKQHIGLVFGIWMKDPNDPQAPVRAGTGARNARAGFDKSMERIEQRERRLKEIRP